MERQRTFSNETFKQLDMELHMRKTKTVAIFRLKPMRNIKTWMANMNIFSNWINFTCIYSVIEERCPGT